MQRKILVMAIFMFLLTACSKMDSSEALNRDNVKEQNSETMSMHHEETTEVSEEKIYTEDSSDKEEFVRSIDVGINLISSKNMPIASEKLVYKGENMQYGAVLQNKNSFDVDYTFMILVNGTVQPFMLDGETQEINNKTYEMKAGEERIIHFQFKPVQVSNDKDSLLSFVGAVVRKNPATSIDNVLMNSTITDYNILLATEKEEYNIVNKEEKNPVGKVIEKVENKEEDVACKVVLSDKEESHATISKIRNDELSIDKVNMYLANERQSNIRLLLLNEGELLYGFDKKIYADIQSTENCVYEIKLNKDGLGKDKLNKSCIIIIDMEEIEKELSGEIDSVNNIIGISQVYILSK